MKIEVYCIILGGTESLLDLKLPYDFEFCKLRENNMPINKKIRDQEGNLITQYSGSNLNSDSSNPEFIVLFKSEVIKENSSFKEYMDKVTKKIDKIMSLFQIFKQSQISYYQIFYVVDNRNILITSIIDSTGLISRKYGILSNEKSKIEDFLQLKDNIYNELSILIVNYSNSTKFIDLSMQLQYLVTIGEILTVNNGDLKRKVFSKRLSALTENKENEKELYRIYKLRNDWVHSGKQEAISEKDILELREIICKVIMYYINCMGREIIKNPNIVFADVKKNVIKEADSK